MKDWSPDSWRTRPNGQRVEYPDDEALAAALEELSSLPPLVTSWEIESLKRQLAEACHGRAFLLQGGDCSESFSDCRPETIVSKLKILLKMSLILVYGCKQRVIRVGRFAGQYAKPRSSLTETRDGVTLPSYRGNLINRRGFTPVDRTPDPTLLLRGYERAALTLNFIRSLVEGGFADIRHPELWDLDFVNHSEHSHEYRRIMDAVSQAVSFMEAVAGRPFVELERGEVLRQPRGPAPGLGACPDPAGAAASGLVRPDDAFPLDRRSHARTGCGARRVLPRYRQSDWREGRPVLHSR